VIFPKRTRLQNPKDVLKDLIFEEETVSPPKSDFPVMDKAEVGDKARVWASS
jgi:hypothetical protein